MALVKLFLQTDTVFTSDGERTISPLSSKVTENIDSDYFLEVVIGKIDAIGIKTEQIFAVYYKSSWQAFRIKRIEDRGFTTYYKAWHVSYDAQDYVIEDLLLNGVQFNTALTNIKSECSTGCTITLSSQKTVSVEIELHYCTLLDAIFKLQDNYNCHILRDNFEITFINTIGSDKGIDIEYGKNLVNATKYEKTDDLVTKLYPTMAIGDKEYTIDPLTKDGYDRTYEKHVEFYTMYGDYFTSLLSQKNTFSNTISSRQSEITCIDNDISKATTDISNINGKINTEKANYSVLTTYYAGKLTDSTFKSLAYSFIHTGINEQIANVTNQYDATNSKLTTYQGLLDAAKTDLDTKQTSYDTYAQKNYIKNAVEVSGQLEESKVKYNSYQQNVETLKKELSDLSVKKNRLTGYKTSYDSITLFTQLTLTDCIKVANNSGLSLYYNALSKYISDHANSISNKTEYERNMKSYANNVLSYYIELNNRTDDKISYQELKTAKNTEITQITTSMEDMNTTIETDVKADLLNQAQIHINKYCKPQVSYTVNTLNEDVEIGDTVVVKYTPFGTDLEIIVMQTIYDTITEKVVSITFGNTDATLKSMQDSLFDKTNQAIANTNVMLQNAYSSMMNHVDGIQGYVTGMQQTNNKDGKLQELESQLHVAQSEISEKVSERIANELYESKIDVTSQGILQQVSSTYQTISDATSNYNSTVTNVKVEYASGTSQTTAPTTGWSTTSPTWQKNKYIWQKTTKTLGSGTTTESTVCIQGAKGDKGQAGTNGTNGIDGENGIDGTNGTDGIGISSYTITYQNGTSGTTAPTGTWSSSIPTVSANEYLWTRTVTTFTDSTSKTSYSIGKIGANGAPGANGTNGTNGADGVSVLSYDVEYYKSTSSSTISGGSWSTNAPTWENGKYIWSRTKTLKSDSTSYIYSNAVCLTGSKGTNGTNGINGAPGTNGADGADGVDGVGVSSIEELYCKTNSKATIPSDSLFTAYNPTTHAWENGYYLWSASKINYDNGTSEIVGKSCDSSWEAVNDVQDNLDDAVTDYTQKISTVQQTADKISWLIKNGTSASSFTLTDKLTSLMSGALNISAFTTFKSAIENGTSTVIDGGAIKTNTITTDKLNVTDLSAICAKIANFDIGTGYLIGRSKPRSEAITSSPSYEVSMYVPDKDNLSSSVFCVRKFEFETNYLNIFKITGNGDAVSSDGTNYTKMSSGVFESKSSAITDGYDNYMQFKNAIFTISKGSAFGKTRLEISSECLKGYDSNGNISYEIKNSWESSIANSTPFCFYNGVYFEDGVYVNNKGSVFGKSGIVQSGNAMYIIGARSDDTLSTSEVQLFNDKTHAYFSPTSNGGVTLGISNRKFDSIYANHNVTTSDRKLKKYVADLSFSKEFIMSLRPVSYRMKKKDGCLGVRTHMGFIAQEVNDISKTLNKNLAIAQASYIGENEEIQYLDNYDDIDDEKLMWGLESDEFIAPAISLLQDIELRLEALEGGVK